MPGLEPVTEAMLREPNPGDWLMIRRDYSATSFSPLDQITRDNVDSLRLAWTWPMRDGGTNQPAPLAYNGTIYLAHTGGIVQALDGRTGALVWEYRVGAEVAPRGLALFDDKLIFIKADGWAFSAQEAELVALDARTGELVWQAVMPNVYASNSGPDHSGHGHLLGLRGQQVLHQRLRSRHWRATVALSNRGPDRRAGRRYLGRSCRHVSRRQRAVDHGQLRSRAQSDLLGYGAGQTLDAGESRHGYARRRALLQLDAGARCDDG